MAPIHKNLSGRANHIIVHTGQHYDYRMSEIFFKEFELPQPDFNLEVGSGSANYQIGEILMRLEKVLAKIEPDLILTYGDTNSTVAGALSARKSNIPSGHVESGLRSFDRRMPEEENRVITDHISEYLFAPTDAAIDNLRKENVQGMVFHTGDISVEIINDTLKLESTILVDHNLVPSSYILLTMHRAENTNCPRILKSVIMAIKMIRESIVVFPIHPRTKKILQEIGLYEILESCQHVILIPPTGYVDFINLIKSAHKVVTDSGGVQKEAYLLGTPCITLRSNTEWIETVAEDWNILVGTETESVVKAIREWLPSVNSRKTIFGHGNTSAQIIKIIEDEISKIP